MITHNANPDTPKTSKPTRAADWRLHIVIILLIALIPRIIYFLQIRTWPFFFYPVVDSLEQWRWAGILRTTNLLGNAEVVAKAPLYSYYLAFNQWLFGEVGAMGPGTTGLVSAHLLQLLLGSVTCGLTYLIGRRVFGPAEGMIGGLLLALYSPGIYRDGQLLDTALATFLAAVFLLALFAAFDRPGAWRWLVAGALLGLLGLTRPNLLLLAVLVVVLMAVWMRRELPIPRLTAAIAIFLAGVALPILPAVGRNYRILHGFVPFSTLGGINLYTGNNPHSDGYSPVPSGIAWERTWHEAIAHGAHGPVARDRYWYGKVLQFIKQHPGAALALFVKKLYLYWNAYEIPNNVSYAWGREHSSLLRIMPFSFAVVGPLALVGMATGAWRNRRAWLLALSILTQMLAVSAFFVAGRYRMPALPALSVFAAFVLVQCGRWAARRRARPLALALVALAACSLLVNSDFYGVRRTNGANRDYYYLGQSYMLSHDGESAITALREAVQQHPDDADACAFLAEAELLTGQPRAAVEHYKMALAAAPDYTVAAARLGTVYLEEKWPAAEVEPLLRRAVSLQSGNVYGLAVLVRLDLAMGDFKRAQADLDAAAQGLARMNPSDTRTASIAQAVLVAAAEAQSVGLRMPPEIR